MQSIPPHCHDSNCARISHHEDAIATEPSLSIVHSHLFSANSARCGIFLKTQSSLPGSRTFALSATNRSDRDPLNPRRPENERPHRPIEFSPVVNICIATEAEYIWRIAAVAGWQAAVSRIPSHQHHQIVAAAVGVWPRRTRARNPQLPGNLSSR